MNRVKVLARHSASRNFLQPSIKVINELKRELEEKTEEPKSESTCIKESIDIIPEDEKDSEFEVNTMSNNIILKREISRFKLLFTREVKYFLYSIVSPINFIHTSHIEKIKDKEVSIIINNMENKDITLDIIYLAFH